MASRKRQIMITALIITLILAMIGWHYYIRFKTLKAQWGNMPPPVVEVVKLIQQPWHTQIAATGALSAVEGTLLKAETAGRITQIYFKSGQTVKAGNLLLAIDPGIIQGQLTAAQAQANLTKGDYERALKLAKNSVLSKQDIATAFANKQTDAAKVRSLKAQLAQNIIEAPFAGQLGLCLVNLGDYVTIGQSLVNLQSLHQLRLDFAIPEQFANQVKVGDALTFTTNQSEPLTATVSGVDTALDPSTRTLAIRALVDNTQHQLIPGNFAQISLSIGKIVNHLTVPQIALVYETDANYVYKIVDHKAVKIPIKVLQQNTHQVAIQANLQVGDLIIVAGQQKIIDGQTISLAKH